jgi:hypothetical protein
MAPGVVTDVCTPGASKRFQHRLARVVVRHAIA